MGDASTPIIKDLRNSAGPVAKAFETNNEPLSVIIGPTGGGKTESSVRRILRIARSQHPSPKDGIRKCRIVCVGNTYRDLWDKAIPSYLKVFNKDYGHWQGAKGNPATHEMDFKMYEGGEAISLHIEVWFRAKSDDQSLEDFVRGLECTCWWLQEMDQLPEDILSLTSNRVGRYPEPDDRYPKGHAERMGWAPSFMGVWGDTNMPVVETWLYKRAFEKKLFGAGLFVQPPAILENGHVNPRAENLHNLDKIPIDRQKYSNYYDWQKAVMGIYDTARLLMLKKSYDRRGKAVYGKFDRAKNCLASIAFDPSLPLIIGCDTGNTLKHAAIFMQPRPGGGVNVIDEISPRDRTCSINQFAAEIKQKVKLRFDPGIYYRRFDIILKVDPSARATMAAQGDETVTITYAQFLGNLTGYDTSLADTNDPGSRRSSVEELLKLDGGLLIDEGRCPDLVTGLEGMYKFKQVGKVTSPEIEKNDFSHPCEGLEYGCLSINGASIFFGTSAANSASDNDDDYDQQPVASGY